MRLLKPIKDELWIEKFRRKDFWIRRRRSYSEKLYARIVGSYVGWWTYFRVHSIWHRAALLIDPLSCGGLYSHLRSFLFNWLVVDIWWGIKHKTWKVFHRKEWEKQCALMDACMRASEEGFADPMPSPDWLPEGSFHGSILVERYFKRVLEILKEGESHE